jgi:hypothetical protein
MAAGILVGATIAVSFLSRIAGIYTARVQYPGVA